MDALALQMQIRQYQSRITMLERSNEELRGKIARVNTALEGYKKKHSELERCLNHEKMRSNEFRWVSPIKATSSYADILDGLSSQVGRQRAEDAFMNISNKLNKQKQLLENEIQSNNRSILILNQEMAYLRTRMMSLS